MRLNQDKLKAAGGGGVSFMEGFGVKKAEITEASDAFN